MNIEHELGLIKRELSLLRNKISDVFKTTQDGEQLNNVNVKFEGGLSMGDVEGVVASDDGVTETGLRSVTFIASSDFAGEIAGVVLNPKESITLTCSLGLGSIYYAVSGGSLRIFKIW